MNKMTVEEVIAYIKSDFKVHSNSKHKRIAHEKDEILYFVESCERNNIKSISQIDNIVLKHRSKANKIIDKLNPTTLISELAYHLALDNLGFDRDGFPYSIRVFHPDLADENISL